MYCIYKSLYVKYMKFNYMKRNWNGFGQFG